LATWMIIQRMKRAGAFNSLRGYAVLGGGDPWGLGAISPTDATNQIFPSARITGSAGHNQAAWDSILASAQAEQMLGARGEIAYVPGTIDCAKASGQAAQAGMQDLKLVSTGAGLALTGATVGYAIANSATFAVASAALAPITLGISIAVAGIVAIFSVIFAHHAQAVAKEQTILCSAVPAANNYLNIITQAVSEGLATPAQGIAALDSLVSDFQSTVASIMHGTDPTSSGECNAACVMFSELKAIVLVKKSQLQDLIAAQQPAAMPSASGPVVTAPVTSGSTATIPTSFGTSAAPSAAVTTPAAVAAAAAAASTGPNWLGIAALVIGGFFLMRAI
jgi:hypothetical protein